MKYKVGDQVIFNKKNIKNLKKIDDSDRWALEHLNEIFKINEIDRQLIIIINKGKQYHFYEEELIPIVKFKINKLIEEINAENR